MKYDMTYGGKKPTNGIRNPQCDVIRNPQYDVRYVMIYMTQARQRKNYEIQYDLNPNLQNVIVIDCVVEVCVCLYVHTLVRCVCVFHARGMAA